MRSAEDDDKPRLGEAFSSGSHQFADAITAAEPAAEDLLADVKLTKRLRRRVCPLLESLGFVITEQQRCDEVGVTCKKVEVAFKDPVSFVLLHMPKTLLATPSGPNVAAVGYLPHVLDAGDRVLIFSDGLKGQPKPPYRKMWSIWAGEGKVTAAFVAWDDVEFILDKPDDERMATLAQVLDVTFGTDSALLAAQAEAPAHAPVGGNGGGLAVAPRRPPPDVTLTRAETDLFARVLSEQAFGAPVKPQDYFNDLADRSDVDRQEVMRLTGTWTGDLSLDAHRLVGWARARNSFGPGHERTREAVLGVLIEELAKSTFSADMQDLGRMAIRRRLLSLKATKALAARLDIEEDLEP